MKKILCGLLVLVFLSGMARGQGSDFAAAAQVWECNRSDILRISNSASEYYDAIVLLADRFAATSYSEFSAYVDEIRELRSDWYSNDRLVVPDCKEALSLAEDVGFILNELYIAALLAQSNFYTLDVDPQLTRDNAQHMVDHFEAGAQRIANSRLMIQLLNLQP